MRLDHVFPRAHAALAGQSFGLLIHGTGRPRDHAPGVRRTKAPVQVEVTPIGQDALALSNSYPAKVPRYLGFRTGALFMCQLLHLGDEFPPFSPQLASTSTTNIIEGQNNAEKHFPIGAASATQSSHCIHARRNCMIPFPAHLVRELTPPPLSQPKPLHHALKRPFGLPKQLPDCLGRVINPIHPPQKPPSPLPKHFPHRRHRLPHHHPRIVVQHPQHLLSPFHRWRCTNDILPKPHRPRPPHRTHARAHHVGNVHPPVCELAHLEVVVVQRGAAVRVIVSLGEEAARSEHDDGQPGLLVDDGAQVLGGELGCAVDVLGAGGY